MISEKINNYVKLLLEKRQVEVLDFVESLMEKSENKALRVEESDWSTLSLSHAVKGTDTKDEIEYTLDDVKQFF